MQQAGRVFSHGALSNPPANARPPSSPKFIRAHNILARPPTRLASVLLLQLLSNTSDRSRISDRCDSRQNKTHTFQKESKNIFLPLCSQSAQPFQSLATRAEAWQAIPGVSMWVMTMVRRVYTLQFARRPPHRGDESAGKRIHRNRSSSPERVRLFPRPQKIRRPATCRLLNYALMKKSFRMITLNRSSRKYAQGTGSCRWI